MGLVSNLLYFTVFSNLFWFVLLFTILYWLYMRKLVAYYDTNIERTDHKIFIVTGAESGIGKATVNLLAARGGRIIMACKDVTLGEAAKNEIVTRTKNEALEVRHLDLASLESVRKFSAEIHKSLDKLDALINNPPSCCSAEATTADGLNTIMQVNHFGPYLLTNLLLDLLKNTPSSRIVFVSSLFHHLHKFCVDNINCDKENLPCCRVYFNSKLASILTAKYFARMLQGTGVTANSLHPGFPKPDSSVETCTGSFVGVLFNIWRRIFGKTFNEAAMTSVYVATEIKLAYVTGHHFSECKESRCVANIASNRNLQDKLFEKSAELVHLRSEERHL